MRSNDNPFAEIARWVMEAPESVERGSLCIAVERSEKDNQVMVGLNIHGSDNILCKGIDMTLFGEHEAQRKVQALLNEVFRANSDKDGIRHVMDLCFGDMSEYKEYAGNKSNNEKDETI